MDPETFHKIDQWLKKILEGSSQSSNSRGNAPTPPPNLKSLLKFIPIFLLLLIVYLGYSSYYTVRPDEEAVILRLGRYQKTSPPGLHFKFPLIDTLYLVQTTKIHQTEFGFRTSVTRSEGRTDYKSGNFKNESLMLTGDLNVADVEWVVQYKISDPFKFLFKASSPINNIRDVSESVMRRVVGDRSVGEVLTTGRAEIASEAKMMMQDILDRYDIGILVTAVKLQDVNPPESVKASFNEVNAAKQEQEKLVNQAEEAYNKVIPEARGKAEKVISEARGYAIALINRSQGDTDKFLAVLTEYQKAPAVTKKRIYIETMEKIFSQSKDFMVLDSDLKGVLPIFNNTPAVTK
jgi:membrane protease subunit HflK